MATQRTPTYLADGRVTAFGAEDALLLDFGSVTGDPMAIKVGGGTYFSFERDGSFRLEEDVVWNIDQGGNVGEQYDFRPQSVNAVVTVAVGAISGTGDGAQLTLNRLVLGHGDVHKYIDADQGPLATQPGTPSQRYNATHQRWEFTNDGVVWYPFLASAGGAVTPSWDEIYTPYKTLDINSTTLTWTQTAVNSGPAFTISRDLPAASTDAPIMVVANLSQTDDKAALVVSTWGDKAGQGKSALEVNGSSQGIVPGNEMIGEGIVMFSDAADAAGSRLIGLDLFETNAFGSGDRVAMRVSGANWTHAIRAEGGLIDLTHTLPAAMADNAIWAHISQSVTGGTVVGWDQTVSVGHLITMASGGMTPGVTKFATTAGLALLMSGVGGDDPYSTLVGIDISSVAGAGNAVRQAIRVDSAWDYCFDSGSGQMKLRSQTDLAKSLLHLTQNDVNEPFAFFEGTKNDAAGVDPGLTANISQLNGSGAVVGPQAAGAGPDTGWGFYAMVEMEVDFGTGPVRGWVPFYTADVVPP